MNRLEMTLPPIAIADRQPPYAPEAEISVLGGMLIDGDAVAKAIEIVDDTMFYREGNRRVFRAMARLFTRGQVVDPVTLREELQKTDELESVGGTNYLSELLDAVPTAANIEYHARIVRERALLRRLIEASSQIIRDSYEPGERSVEEVLDEAEARVFQVAQSHDREGFVWIKKILYPTFEKIEQLQAAKGGITGVPTGFYDLDEMTGGFQKGDLVIVAARPSMGKTAMVTGVALHASISHQIPTAVF
jgi:replicative DNA helicase